MSDKKFYMFSVLILIAAILLSYKYEDTEASTNDTLQYFKKMNYIMRIVDNVYVDEPDNEKMMEGAIEGLLQGLDPHSTYIPAEEQKEVEEDFKGEFGGIGIEFEIKNRFLTVISPIPDTPSDRLGLQPGDRIIRIDGKTAVGITTSEVFKRLKGVIGTKVNITIARTGVDKPLEFEINRAAIPVHSVIAKCMLDDKKTGYISINRFAYKTASELEEALQTLEGRGMTQLILDLRGNPGGLMDQAVEITDKFLDAGKMIVYTKGRFKDFDDEYFSTRQATHGKMPIIVLIDAGSASASEIVSGALQDHDRALILGTKSFGKGLVQRPFDLGDGSVARITIARYYTPTGRLIQRPYENGNESYIYDRFISDEDLTEKQKFKRDSIKKAQTYYTLRKKRVVYGGGGITPDSTITYDLYSDLLTDLFRKRVFQDHSIDFFNSNKNNKGKWKEDFETYYDSFEVSDESVEKFIEIAEKNNIFIVNKIPDKEDIKKGDVYYTKGNLKRGAKSVIIEIKPSENNDVKHHTKGDFEKDLERIKLEIKYNIARQYYKDKTLYPRIKAMSDKFVKKALTLFDEAKKLADIK
ncbi:MAG: S41 family peptidase [Candidatus Delongbacteria bacterium]|jgi:carboxyl-terminal processing protease|nr:S41 family peptidase [Candidatus Delongbacteria bacterium]